MSASHLTRYFKDGARDWQAREAARRYHRDRGEVRANMVEHCEDRDLDDPRCGTIRIHLRSDSTMLVRDGVLALAMLRAANAGPGAVGFEIGER